MYPMNKQNLLISIFVALAVVAVPAHAVIKKVGQTGFQFLKIDMSTRAAGMGGSYITINNDATSMLYNPAGLGFMEPKIDAFVTQTKWIADISYIGGGVAASLGDWGTVGASWMIADYGNDFIGTRYDPTSSQGYIETGNLTVSSYMVGLSYAKALTDKFTIGGQVKNCYQHLGQSIIDTLGTTRINELSGLAYDFGTIFYPGFKSFRIGMNIRNFAQEYKYEEEGFELPLTFVIGAAMDVLDLVGDHENSLLLSIDAVHPRDYTERINFGAEYTFMKMLSLRVGYKYNYDNEGFTAGIGFQQQIGKASINVGYAYTPMQYFNTVHRLSVGISYY
jgi:long-subunit fatty acid transport protein